ncbi:hypothetical protein AAG906_011224 [Vitis piasezkii]
MGWVHGPLALRVDEPLVPMKSSTQIEKASYERWERSNHLSLMFVKSNIGKSIYGSIPECAKVKEYLKAIEQQFETSGKVVANSLMTKMCSMKFNDTKGVRDHIMEKRDIAT